MVKAIDDKDGQVRDTALHCVGILKGRYGEAKVASALKDVNPQKEQKINEAAAEVKPSKYDRPENYKPPPPKKAAAEKKDDDELMSLDDAPKKKPPANIGKKPVKKEKKEDEEMKDEGAPPVKKAPPTLGQKPAAAEKKPPAAPTKAPTAPKIQDEDLGSGLSKEEAMEKV